MPWKHVLAPTKGLVTNAPPTYLDPRASPEMSGVILKDGEVRSDFGMTAFPTVGLLKTNQLHGTFMKAEQFFLLSGLSYLIALTTTDVYYYNTSTNAWECVTRGETIEDCEDAWTASANVTSAVDATTRMKGTNAVKLTIAAAFGTGIAAYENFSSDDFTAHTGVHYWIRSSVATAAGDLQLIIDDTNGCVSATETLDVPALVADTWTPVSIDFADASNLGAVLSVGLNVAVDNGAQIVHIDDVRATTAHTGDEDNKFSTDVLNDTYMMTNGVDLPTKITIAGGVIHAVNTLTLPTGAITTCEVLLVFKDHVLYMNNTENGGNAPQRVSWSNIGDMADHVAGTAGFQDLLDDESWIMGAKVLSENEVTIYKETSIVQCTWVGGHTPFRFTTIKSDRGLINKECVVDTGKGHAVLALNNMYLYNGDPNVQDIDAAIKPTFYKQLDGEYLTRAFLIYQPQDNELQIWVASNATTPDKGFTLNLEDAAWYLKDRNITGYGYYKSQSSLTIGDLVGTIGEQNWTFGSQLTRSQYPITLVGDADGKVYQLDEASLNNGGVAIINTFETPDFVMPETTDFFAGNMRVAQFIFEAAGQSITTHYSTDGGLTWAPTQGAGSHITALTSVYTKYEQFFETDAKKIRFRFMNVDASSGFHLRYFAFYWLPRTWRK